MARIYACGDCAPYGHPCGVCKARHRNRKPHPQRSEGVSLSEVGWGSSLPQTTLDLGNGATIEEFGDEFEEHIIAQTQLTGTFSP